MADKVGATPSTLERGAVTRIRESTPSTRGYAAAVTLVGTRRLDVRAPRSSAHRSEAL
jgi:hypothetical protein